LIGYQFLKNTKFGVKTKETLLDRLDRIDAVHKYSGLSSDEESEVREILDATKQMGWEEGTARSLYYLGRILEWKREMPTAKKVTVQARKIAEKLEMKLLLADCKASEANVLLWNYKLKEAYRAALKAREIAERNENYHAIILSQYILGSVSQRYGVDDEALIYFQQGLTLAEKNKYVKFQGVIFDVLSQLFLNRHRFKDAEHYAKLYASVQNKLQNKARIIYSEIVLAQIYIESHKLIEARKIIEGIGSHEHILHAVDKGTLLLCKGKLAQYERKLQQAEIFIREAIDIFSQLNRNTLTANAYSILCEMYLEKKNAKDALKFAKLALKIIQPGMDEYIETQLYRLMYEASKLSKDAFNALKFLELYNERFSQQEKKLLESRIQFIELQAEYQMQQAEITEERRRAEQLRIELGLKEAELTAKTRHLIKQTESLAQFRDDLRAIIHRSPANDPLIQEIKDRLSETPESRLSWQDFDKEFQSAHPTFINKLKLKHPSLSVKEEKICTMLRLGLTSVDIAKLLVLSERNIENHRYRIRKKLTLNTEKSLHEYLATI
jgi:DNA-binding CsgD family transcriptional regulator